MEHMEHKVETKERHRLSLEDANRFVGENAYEARGVNADGGPSRCVDGRYPRLEDIPALAQPGGDACDLMVALAGLRRLGIDLREGNTREAALNAVVELLGGPGALRFHTDTRATEAHASVARGCGHLNQADKAAKEGRS